MVNGVWDLKLPVWRKKCEERRVQVPNDPFLSEPTLALHWGKDPSRQVSREP